MAKVLKEYGYTQKGRGMYYISIPQTGLMRKGQLISDDDTDEWFARRVKKLGLIRAPYLEEAAEWLRDKKDIHVCPEFCELYPDRWYIVSIDSRPLNGTKISKIDGRPIDYPLSFDSYNKALEAGINHVLTNVLNNETE